ncbi:MAG: putative toxin-antitoxin system toxin component, PIN family [Bacteroidia bacterium]|nr:putative toxin-antitoxin system toxin component, PIN family [Bacteroidia bacterium]
MQENKIRIIVDVNILISFLIGKAISSKFIRILEDTRFEILSCNELNDELRDVLARPKFNKYISPAEAEQFIQLFSLATEKVNISATVTISSDPDDNYLLALAKDGKAQYLITGDKKHLLALKRFENTKIISFPEFYTLFFTNCIQQLF